MQKHTEFSENYSMPAGWFRINDMLDGDRELEDDGRSPKLRTATKPVAAGYRRHSCWIMTSYLNAANHWNLLVLDVNKSSNLSTDTSIVMPVGS